MGTFTPLPTAMCSLGLVHTHLCALCQPPLRPGSFREPCLPRDSSSDDPLLWPWICPVCEADTALRQVLDDLQQSWESQAVRERTMPSGRRWGLICLGAVPAGGCQLGQDLALAAGESVDKVRGSDQPDVVSSPSVRFVGFTLNSCFAFLTHSETLNSQFGILAAHQSCPQI